jgi:UPF0716 protein FxsA
MWLMLAFLALPLVEIALFVVIGGAIGLWLTLGWVVLSAILGVLILKGVARGGPISFTRDVRGLRDPMTPIAGRALTILGAGLLVLPGFLTDAMGLLFLLPPVQGVLAAALSRRLRTPGQSEHFSMTIDGDWTEAEPPEESAPQDTGKTLPPSGWTRH